MANDLIKHLQEHAILGVTSGGGGGSSEPAYGTIQGNSGTASALVVNSSIIIQGTNSISTVASNGSPDTLIIDGTNLLPRDGSRAMTANLNLGGFSITNVNLVDGVDVSSLGDHGSLSGLSDDDHTIYLKADGTRALTGNLAVNNSITIDGRDISVDGSTQDTHIADGTIHFTESSINHLNIQNIGTNSHSAIDTHIATTGLHFSETSISHVNILDRGVYTHPQIDSHINDSTIHYVQSSIDHGVLQGLSDDDHTQYALLAGRNTGQTLYGGTAASGILTLSSTSNVTKGKIYIGSDSVYDEATLQLGIGTLTPNTNVKSHVVHSNLPIRAERTTATTDASQTVVGLLTTCTSNMIDGFGSGISFTIKDTAAVINSIANIFGVRYGADNSGRLSFYTYNAGVGTEKMTILPDGKIGMGISVPTQPLHVVGKIRSDITGGNPGGLTVFTAADGDALLDCYGDAGGGLNTVWSLRWQNTSFQSQTKTWRFRFGGDSTPNAFMMGWFDLMPVLTLTQTNRVGILTSTPVNPLDVEGSVAIGAAYAGTSTAPTDGMIVVGSVGIGTASPSANAKVDITRSDTSTVIAGLELAQDSTGDALMRFTLGTSRAFSLGIDNSDADKFKIGTAANATSGADTGTILTLESSTSNVGIGTTSADARLHVVDSDQAIRAERTTAATNTNQIVGSFLATSSSDMIDGFGSGLTLYIEDTAAVANPIASIFGVRSGADNSGRLSFHTYNAGSSTEKMAILPNGNVGIGIAASEALLHIFASSVTGTLPSSALLGLEKNDDAHLSFLSSNASGKTAGLLFGDSGSTTIGSLLYKHDVDSLVFTTSGIERALIYNDGGFVVGSPTGGSKGSGTINAQEVYDDNVLLTCYVPEYVIGRNIDFEKWDKTIPERKFEHKAARRFMSVAEEELNPRLYANKWLKNGHLPALPSPSEWEQSNNKFAIGKIVQGLWETVEVQAEHIRILTNTIDDLQEKILIMQDQIANIKNLE